MNGNCDKVLGWIGLSEGGYVNHPKDPGGATDRGITQRTYDAWRKAQGLSKKSVRGISKAEADQIIVTQYLKPIKFDDLPSGLDYAIADFSVNSGPARAVKEIQRLVGFTGADVDGIMGQRTLAAIETRNIPTLIQKYCKARVTYLKGLSTWATFGKGWNMRVMGKFEGVQDNDIGVVDRAVRLAQNRPSIPAPSVIAPAKARDEDRSEATWISKALEEPTVWIPAVGGVVSGVMDGDGPMQWAVAATIVVGALLAGTRLLKKNL